jgi:hypothetical protein
VPWCYHDRSYPEEARRGTVLLWSPRQGTRTESQVRSEEFRFYFSAFIQAARSVTWTLGNEEPEKWKAWEPKWKATRNNEEQKLLDLTNELRLDEAKRGGANALVEWEVVALHELLVEPWKKPAAQQSVALQRCAILSVVGGA